MSACAEWNETRIRGLAGKRRGPLWRKQASRVWFRVQRFRVVATGKARVLLARTEAVGARVAQERTKLALSQARGGLDGVDGVDGCEVTRGFLVEESADHSDVRIRKVGKSGKSRRAQDEIAARVSEAKTFTWPSQRLSNVPNGRVWSTEYEIVADEVTDGGLRVHFPNTLFQSGSRGCRLAGCC